MIFLISVCNIYKKIYINKYKYYLIQNIDSENDKIKKTTKKQSVQRPIRNLKIYKIMNT